MVSIWRGSASILKIQVRTAFVLLAFAVALMPVAGAQTRPVSTFTLLYSFTGTSGAYPLAGLVIDSNGNLYGTTSEGGAYGEGTVFKVSASGSETVLHSFKGGFSDGQFPIASLVRDAAGTLYGTTTRGGLYGYGTVFKVAKNGDESLLHSFGKAASDGRYPSAGLVFGLDGDLYGTTQEGGASGFGTIFKLTTSGDESVVHSFAGNPSDGQYPVQGLVVDAQGNFYGATELGGTFNDGAVFKLDDEGNETVLLSLSGGPKGAYPYGGVIVDSAGNVYSTTAYGGNGIGLVFVLDPSGAETVLYTFSGQDGSFPSAGLIRDAKGHLYGTTEFGGADGAGVVFAVNNAGKEVVLHSFDGTDGADLFSTLVSDAAGNLYGTATEGGPDNKGTVFKLVP
jgi:uncharacterized repeat protein (TIGR03803 family)